MSCFDLPLGSDYSIPGDRRVWSEGAVEVTVDWSDLTPHFTPDANTKG